MRKSGIMRLMVISAILLVVLVVIGGCLRSEYSQWGFGEDVCCKADFALKGEDQFRVSSDHIWSKKF